MPSQAKHEWSISVSHGESDHLCHIQAVGYSTNNVMVLMESHCWLNYCEQKAETDATCAVSWIWYFAVHDWFENVDNLKNSIGKYRKV